MKRPSLLVPAIAIAALLVAAPVAAAAAGPTQQFVSVDFRLAPVNDLRAHVEARDDEVTLEIAGGNSAAVYKVEGEITEAGLKAQFGKLGEIDVAFDPTKTLSKSNPPKGCEGEPWTEREGLFTGTIQFTGEREYARIEASRAKGEMSVASEWKCPRTKGPIRLDDSPRLSLRRPRERSEPKAEESATLFAHSRRCRCTFAAFAVRYPNGRGKTILYGARAENREGMKISRVTYARAGASAFIFDHGAGTAEVHPPQPFSGDATFKRRPHGRNLWRSTIRVPLLGADPVSLGGGSFRAGLRRDFPGD